MLQIPLKELDVRDKVYIAEAWMKQQPQLDLKVVNYFSHGVYARELHIPAGTMLTGEIHKYENLNILSEGEISVLVNDEIKRIKAPFTVVSPAGTKRIAYAHTNCIWTTIHGTFETDLNLIENHFIAHNEQEWLEFCGSNQLELGFN